MCLPVAQNINHTVPSIGCNNSQNELMYHHYYLPLRKDKVKQQTAVIHANFTRFRVDFVWGSSAWKGSGTLLGKGGQG